MNKRNVYFAVTTVILLCLITWPGAVAFANPSFTVGSNYYLTVFAYPHDILKWPGQGVVFYYNPQTLPWQGDVTDIANRPSESYTNNYQSVDFATPSDYVGDPVDVRSWMKVSSYAYKKRYSVGGLSTTKYGKLLFELGKTSVDMELTAEGVGRAYETVGEVNEYYLVPFSGQTNSARDNIDFTVTYANIFFNHPVGFRLRYIDKSSEVPSGYVSFTREGQTYNTPHLTWGWATTGCNHIFGYSHINTDAFFQNSYTVFNGHQMDLQFSFEHNGNYKSGIRYRRGIEDGENYTWEYDAGSEYEGKYNINETWKDRKASRLIRGYSKVRFRQIGDLDLGMLFFLQYDSKANTSINKIVESDPVSVESAKEFIIETNPFLNYRFGRGYLDCGLLMELSRTGMKNTRTRWNSVSGSDQTDVLWSTTPYSGWSPSWESFSEGRTLFFATGFEAYSSVGVYKRLAIQSRLLVLRKFTYTDKIYGTSDIPAGGNSFEFTQTHERNDYKNEAWMTGSVGFSYGFGPVQALVSLDLPLAYLIKQETTLEGNDTFLFEHSKKSMWQVQEPLTSRILLVYALGGRPAGHGGPR